MKTAFLTALALALLSSCATSTGPEKPTGRVEVLFDHPESFTDVKDSAMPTDRGRDQILGQIRDYLVSRAASRVPVGDTLRVTFTDIDLAGDFEPWRGPNWNDVRIIKDIYPPALKFTYSVTDSDGKTLLHGTESIRDMTFQMRILADTNDPFRYEKAILSDWIQATLRDIH
jgi:hypothetical protein